jgi:hypothetical protein
MILKKNNKIFELRFIGSSAVNSNNFKWTGKHYARHGNYFKNGGDINNKMIGHFKQKMDHFLILINAT